MSFKRTYDNAERAHVFFTGEGYDDFRKNLNREMQPLGLPFKFANVEQWEYKNKKEEYSAFLTMFNDKELEKYIESVLANTQNESR